MRTKTDNILSRALELPSQARAFVAEKLIESLDVSCHFALSPAWRKEIRKRCREIDDGSVELRDADDVFTKAYGLLE